MRWQSRVEVLPKPGLICRSGGCHKRYFRSSWLDAFPIQRLGCPKDALLEQLKLPLMTPVDA